MTDTVRRAVAAAGQAGDTAPAGDAGGEVERIMALVDTARKAQGLIGMNISAVPFSQRIAETQCARRDRALAAIRDELVRIVAERDQAREQRDQACIDRDQIGRELDDERSACSRARAEVAQVRSDSAASIELRDAIIDKQRTKVSVTLNQRDEANARVDRMRPVVEAAREWVARTDDLLAAKLSGGAIGEPASRVSDAASAVIDAVREYDATSTGRTDAREDGRE